ncbi:MAG TPA: glycine oxidase ThiO [Verrucomicrobiae bacterium]|jgi:glycine oxidase|nr:glycine oxidase ThiO [Verrucomicrobiae bacterium]
MSVMNTWDVIIAGSGIIGVSLALELQERGARVLLLDRGEPGREASSAAAGMLAPADPETPAALRALARESARLYPEFVDMLEDASGVKVDFRRQGTISLLPHAATPPHYQKLSEGDLRRLEPAVRADGMAFFVQEDSVDPPLLMQAALIAARKRGVEIRHNAEVSETRRAGNEIEVRAGRELFRAKTAVNCRGAWAGTPVRPRKGQIFSLRPPQTAMLQHAIVAPDVYLVPRSSGKCVVGATVEDVGYDKTVETSTIRDLHHAAAQLVPELVLLPVLESWAGLRPGTPDNLPILGETEIPGIFIASGHFRNGILLAPVTAPIMANLIAGNPAGADISAFAPDRFAVARV